MNRLIILFLIPTAVFGQSADELAIRNASREFSAEYVRGDFQAMTARYTEDAILMAPSRDVRTGREAILEFWKGTTVPFTHESVPERIIIENNSAHDYGYFYVQTQKPGEPPGPVTSAKYYIRWQKDADGVWRMALDMWNSRQTGWKR